MMQFEGPGDRTRTVIAVASGAAAIAGTFASIDFPVPPHTISITWSLFLPLIVSLAYGWRYAAMAAFLGGAALFPLVLWPTNGWANLVTIVIYGSWYVVHGYAADHRRRRKAFWNNIYFVQLFCSLCYLLLMLTVFPRLFTLNPPVWAPGAPSSIDTDVVSTIAVKQAVLMFALLFLCDILLNTGAVPRALGLPPSPLSRITAWFVPAAAVVGLCTVALYYTLEVVLGGDEISEIVVFATAGEHIRTTALIMALCMVAGLQLAKFLGGRLVAEERMRASEQRHRVLFESAGDAIFLMQGDRFVDCNSKTLDMFGCTREQILGVSPARFSPPEQPGGQASNEKAQEKINAALAGHPQFFEWKHVKGDGTPFDAEVSLNRIELSTGTHLQAIVRDVSERKRTEEVVRQSEERFRSLVESAPEAIFVQSRGRFVYLNPAMLRLLGASASGDLIGTDFMDRISPEYHEAIRERIRVQQETGKAAPLMEQEYVRLDGTGVPVETTAVSIRYQGRDAHLVFVRDITARKKAEDAIRRSEEKLQLILAHSPEAIYVLGSEGNTLYVNAAVSALSGYSSEELLRLPFLELVHPDDRPAILKRRSDRLAGLPTESHYSFRSVDRSGAVHWVENRVMVLPWEEKPATFNFLQDITERKRAEEALKSHALGLLTLLEVSRNLAVTLDQKAVLQATTDGVVRLFGLDTAAVYLLDGDMLRLGATTPPLPADFPEMLRMAPLADHPHIRDAVTTGMPVFVPDIREAELTQSEQVVIEQRGLRTVLYMPLIAGEKTVGVLIVGSIEQPRAISDANIDLCKTLSNLSAIAVENARLYEALGDSEVQYRDLFESAVDAICIVDSKQNYLDVNRRAVELFGYSREELLSKNVRDLIPPDQVPLSEREFAKLATVGSYERFTGKIVKKDGTTIDVEISSSAIVERGVVVGSRDIVRDVTDRTRAEEALRESEERFRSLSEAAFEGIMVHDRGTILDVNTAFVKLFGYETREELIGRNGPDLLLTPESRQRIGQRIRMNESGVVEATGIRKDGTVFVMETDSRQMQYRGRMVRIIMCRDITERKRAEEKLRESEELYRGYFSSSRDSVAIISMDERVIDFNDAALELLGYDSREELLSLAPIAHFVDPEDKRIGLEQLTRNGYIKEYPHQMKRRDGTVIDVLETSVLLRNADGTVRARMSTIRDVTEKKRAEEEREKLIQDIRKALGAVNRSQKEWQDTFDSITDMISIHDKDQNILRANRAFAANMGLSPREVIGRKCYELMHHGASSPVAGCPHLRTVREKATVSEEIRDEQTGRTLHITTYPHLSPDGEVIGTIHVARDITAEKEREMRMIMTERLASLGQMASGIAHEINNPLASVMICTEMLLLRVAEGRYDHAQFEKYLRTIDEEVQRCRDITTNMLAFTRRTAIDRQDVDVQELLDKAVELVEFQGRLKRVQVVKRYGPPMPVRGNEGELRQVFLALVVNALDAMQDRGTLTLETGREGPVCRVRISDTGPGVPAEVRQRIFQPFFTTKSETGGTGLGLSIAHRIIAGHQGTIEVSSEPGAGAAFIVSLPC